MIETQFFILESKLYNECSAEAAIEGVTLDYYLLEFVTIEGPNVEYNGEKWIEIDNQ